MMRAVLLCCLSPVVLGAPGGRIVVSQKFADYAVTKIMAQLQDGVTQLAIPDISGTAKGFQYNVSNFKISSLTCADPKLSFVEGVGFLLHLDQVAVNGSAHWGYQLNSWPHIPNGGGSVDVSSGSTSHITVTLKIVIVKERPQVQIQSMDVNIGSFDIKVQGSALSWLYDLILKSWKNHIGDAINSAVKSIIPTELDQINHIVAGFSFTEAVPLPAPYNKSAIDFRVTNIKALSNAIVADDRCEWYPTDGLPRYSGTSPVVPLTSYATHHLTLEASSYLFDTAFYTFTHQKLLEYNVTPDMVPKSSPVKLSARTFFLFAPGLFRYQGESITILASLIPREGDSAHSIDFQDGFIKATLPASFDFNLNSTTLKEPAFTIKCPLKVAATVNVVGTGNDQSVVVKIKNASCEPLVVAHSAVGAVHTSGLFSIGSAVHMAINDVILPMANKALSAGVKIPVADGVSLANTVTVVDGGKFQLETDFEFNFSKAAAPVYNWPKTWADGSWWTKEQQQDDIVV